MTDSWHPLLLKQLRRSGIPELTALPEDFQNFLRCVSNSYSEGEDARELLSRSIDVSSSEMRELYAKLEAHKNELEIEVEVRTKELTIAHELFRTLSDSSPMGIFRSNATGEYVYVNERYGEIFERQSQSLLEYGWLDYVHPEDKNKLVKQNIFEYGSDQPLAIEYRILTPGGKFRWLSTRSTATLENGKTTGHVGTVEDITTRKEYENELLIAKDAAEYATQSKSEFLANMSHELRTPLHGILSFASFGLRKLETADKAKLREYFGQIQDCGESLLQLLNDLLDLAKLESGKMQLNFKQQPVEGLLTGVIDLFSALATEKDLTVTFVNTNGNIEAEIDADKFQQVIRNLVGNAIKFSPPGGSIELKLEDHTPNFTVSVMDGGGGIPGDELSMIFDKFAQSSSTKTGAGGTGLGLSICREIITAHRGKIWAGNNVGAGAIFHISVPIKRRPKSYGESEATNPNRAHLPE